MAETICTTQELITLIHNVAIKGVLVPKLAKTSSDLTNQFRLVQQKLKNIAFDCCFTGNTLILNNDTFIFEFELTYGSVFVQVFNRNSLRTHIISTINDSQIELLKLYNSSYAPKVYNYVEFKELETQCSKLLEENKRLQRKIDTLIGLDIKGKLETLMNSIKEADNE